MNCSEIELPEEIQLAVRLMQWPVSRSAGAECSVMPHRIRNTRAQSPRPYVVRSPRSRKVKGDNHDVACGLFEWFAAFSHPRQYESLAGELKSIPFIKGDELDINKYVVGRALGGLFYMLGEEEKKSARIPPLVRPIY